MTLPNVDKPVLTDLIGNTVQYIEENIEYLGEQPSGYCIKVMTKAANSGDSVETVTGVGFEPRVILFFYTSTIGSSGFGYYGPSTSYNMMAMYKSRYLSTGSYSADKYGLVYTWPVWFYDYVSVTWINEMRGYVYAINSNGFSFFWDEVSYGYPSTYYVIALCIK